MKLPEDQIWLEPILEPLGLKVTRIDGDTLRFAGHEDGYDMEHIRTWVSDCSNMATACMIVWMAIWYVPQVTWGEWHKKLHALIERSLHGDKDARTTLSRGPNALPWGMFTTTFVCSSKEAS